MVIAPSGVRSPHHIPGATIGSLMPLANLGGDRVGNPVSIRRTTYQRVIVSPMTESSLMPHCEPIRSAGNPRGIDSLLHIPARTTELAAELRGPAPPILMIEVHHSSQTPALMIPARLPPLSQPHAASRTSSAPFAAARPTPTRCPPEATTVDWVRSLTHRLTWVL